MEQRFRRSLSLYGLIKFKLIIDGKPFFFMIDTGAGYNSITPEAAARLKNRLIDAGKNHSYSYSGRVTEKAVKIPILFNHQKHIMKFSIMKYTKDFKLMEERGIHLDGILGLQFLYATKATIDFADLVVRMDRNREQKELQFPIGFIW